jgi:YidC/Oxa1 family membrane protein insertase
MYNFLKDFFSFFSLVSKKHSIIIFSESRHYSKYFRSIVLELEKENFNFFYVCKNDDPLTHELSQKNVKKFYTNFFLLNIFSAVNCKYLLLSTPDIGKKGLKKSKLCEKIIYLFHSPVSTHMIYNEGAFDNYDIIFCIGNHQYLELKERFHILNKNIELVQIGYPYLDFLRNKSKEKASSNDKILIAPSWNSENENYYEIYFSKIIRILLDNAFKVIFRPHPEYVKRYLTNYKNFIQLFMSEKNFEVSDSEDSFEVQKESSLLISDWSGIAFEYAFTFDRPVIFINSEKKVLNKNYNEFSYQPIEISERSEIGQIVHIDELENVTQIIKNLILNEKFYKEKINALRSKIVYNIDCSLVKTIKFFKSKI